MAYFDFSRLITKYSREFILITEGEKTLNSLGEWISGEPAEVSLCGAIIGFSENKVHRSEGNLTTMDKALYILEPIDEVLMSGTVIFEGSKYKIETQKSKDNAYFTGCYSYILKYCGAFDKDSGKGEPDD